MGIRRETEAHIDDSGALLHREVDGTQDIRQITCAIGLECFQRHDLRGGSHEVDDARYHGAMTERHVLWLTELEYRCWIEDRSARLVAHRRRGATADGGLVYVRELRSGTGNVRDKVTTWNENTLEYGIRGTDPRGNEGYPSRTASDAAGLRTWR